MEGAHDLKAMTEIDGNIDTENDDAKSRRPTKEAMPTISSSNKSSPRKQTAASPRSAAKYAAPVTTAANDSPRKKNTPGSPRLKVSTPRLGLKKMLTGAVAAGRMRKKTTTSTKSEAEKAMDAKDEDFLMSVSRGNETAVREALEKGQEVNVATEDGTTAAHFAADRPDTKVLELLLTKGPDLMYANKRGELPITIAVVKARKACVERIIATGKVDLTYTNPHTNHNMLHDCAWNGHNDIAEILLKTGAFKDRMDLPNKHGKSALHIAGMRATPDFCKLLVDNGSTADLKEKTTKWIAQTPAELADSLGKPECGKLLRELSVTLTTVNMAVKLKAKTKKKSAAAAADAVTLPTVASATTVDSATK